MMSVLSSLNPLNFKRPYLFLRVFEFVFLSQMLTPFDNRISSGSLPDPFWSPYIGILQSWQLSLEHLQEMWQHLPDTWAQVVFVGRLWHEFFDME